MTYLLSIELREADNAMTEPGEIIALAQAWAFDISDVLVELDSPALTGKRFAAAVLALRNGEGPVTQADIAVDPRSGL